MNVNDILFHDLLSVASFFFISNMDIWQGFLTANKQLLNVE